MLISDRLARLSSTDNSQGVVRREPAGKLNMVWRWRSVGTERSTGVHPRHEVPEYLIIDIRTEGGQGLDDRLV